MRFLYVTPAYPPFFGGGERFVRSLAQSIAQRGHSITILTSDAQSEQDFWQRPPASFPVKTSEDDSIRVLRCPIRGVPFGRQGLLAWRKLMVILSALPGDQSRLLLQMAQLVPPVTGLGEALYTLGNQYDLVHGFNVSWEHPLAVAWQFARQHRLPFVVTPFAHLASGGHDRMARNSTMDHQRRIMNEADALLVLTSVEKTLLGLWRIAPASWTIIGAGLDPVPATIGTESWFEGLDLPKPFALFIGRLSYDKGALHAVEAVTSLRGRGHSVGLVLVGQASPEFNRLYRGLSETDKTAIRPVGAVTEEQKHALLEASSMLLLPSRSDSFGIVLLEAWAHGKPVIGANSGGIPGVVEDGRDGILVTFGDTVGLARAIRRLLTDSDDSKTMGERGRQRVHQEYSWERVADRVLSSYQEVLAVAQ